MYADAFDLLVLTALVTCEVCHKDPVKKLAEPWLIIWASYAILTGE